MPGPGFEPGLLRPQRSVLTTRRSRRTALLTAGGRRKIISLTLAMHHGCYKLSLKFAMKKASLGDVPKNS